MAGWLFSCRLFPKYHFLGAGSKAGDLLTLGKNPKADSGAARAGMRGNSFARVPCSLRHTESAPGCRASGSAKRMPLAFPSPGTGRLPGTLLPWDTPALVTPFPGGRITSCIPEECPPQQHREGWPSPNLCQTLDKSTIQELNHNPAAPECLWQHPLDSMGNDTVSKTTKSKELGRKIIFSSFITKNKENSPFSEHGLNRNKSA